MSAWKRKRRPGRSTKARRRSIGGQLRDTLGPLDGARTPGSCDHCQAYQKAVPVEEGYRVIRTSMTIGAPSSVNGRQGAVSELERCLTAAEVARWLGVSPKTIYRAVGDGELPTLRIRDRLVFDPAEVREALRHQPEHADQRPGVRQPRPRLVGGHFSGRAREGV